MKKPLQLTLLRFVAIVMVGLALGFTGTASSNGAQNVCATQLNFCVNTGCAPLNFHTTIQECYAWRDCNYQCQVSSCFCQYGPGTPAYQLCITFANSFRDSNTSMCDRFYTEPCRDFH